MESQWLHILRLTEVHTLLMWWRGLVDSSGLELICHMCKSACLLYQSGGGTHIIGYKGTCTCHCKRQGFWLQSGTGDLDTKPRIQNPSFRDSNQQPALAKPELSSQSYKSSILLSELTWEQFIHFTNLVKLRCQTIVLLIFYSYFRLQDC